MRSICRFIPAREYPGSIRTVKFVLEGRFHVLRQPFYYPIPYLFLVTAGTGTLHLDGRDFPLAAGHLFFSLPQYRYTLDASDDFVYLYISFMGDCVHTVFEKLGISAQRPVFAGFSHLIDFWTDAISRVTPENANLLSEGVLLYTLAQIAPAETVEQRRSESARRFDLITEYIDLHYTQQCMSLDEVAAAFSYTPKYLSRIFKAHMQIGFTEYVNNLRVQHACRMLESTVFSIAETAASCGFVDPQYFSKVFRSKTGLSQLAYRKRYAGKQPQ